MAWPDWRRRAGFGLYLHWPFCEAKCPYCDFNSHVVARIDQGRWAEAFVAEIDRAADRVGDRVLNTIYFGGGTPSLMRPDTVERILSHVRARFALANDVEITLEANPGSVEAGRFQGYRAAGVSRVSLGVQALSDADLRRLGRLHDAGQAREALAVADAVFDRFSFDLIYGRQDQTPDAWQSELSEALRLHRGHLSLYQLTIEPETAFGRRFANGGLRGLPDEDLGADLYDLTEQMCRDAGLHSYEVSNYAAPGQESRHNLIYWRGGDYIGIGPGAHGRISDGDTRLATETPLAPGAWLAQAEQPGGATTFAPLSLADQRAELLMMGLRLHEGVERDSFAALGGDPHGAAWDEMQGSGLITVDQTRIRATGSGRLLLNAVLRELIA